MCSICGFVYCCISALSAAQPCAAPSLKDGYIFPVEELYSHETELYYACENGYKPVVDGWWATSTCQNGRWSHVPQCISKCFTSYLCLLVLRFYKTFKFKVKFCEMLLKTIMKVVQKGEELKSTLMAFYIYMKGCLFQMQVKCLNEKVYLPAQNSSAISTNMDFLNLVTTLWLIVNMKIKCNCNNRWSQDQSMVSQLRKMKQEKNIILLLQVMFMLYSMFSVFSVKLSCLLKLLHETVKKSSLLK